MHSEEELFKDKISEIETAGVGRGCETVGGINAVCPFSPNILSLINGPNSGNGSEIAAVFDLHKAVQ